MEEDIMLWDSRTEMRNTFIILVGMFHCRLNLFTFFNVVIYLDHQLQRHVVGNRPSTFVSIPSYTQYHGGHFMRSQQSVSGEGLPRLVWNSCSFTVFTRAPQCSLPCVKWIQFPLLHPLYLRFILTSSYVPVAFKVLSSLSDFCMLRASPFSLFDNFSDRRRVHMTKLSIRPVQFPSWFW